MRTTAGLWRICFSVLSILREIWDVGNPISVSYWIWSVTEISNYRWSSIHGNADRELTESIWKRAQELGLFAFQPRLGVAIMDDHLPLIQAGVPTVNIIDFDYPHWHTLEDTADKCSAESLGVVGQLMLNIIYSGL